MNSNGGACCDRKNPKTRQRLNVAPEPGRE